MNNFRRYTFLVLGVAIVIAITSVAIYVLLPARLAERADSTLASKATHLSEYVAERAGPHVSAGDSVAIGAILDVVSATEGISFVAVLDAGGQVVAGYGKAIRGMKVWKMPDDASAPVFVATATMAGDSGLIGHVHVGVDRVQAAAQADGDRRMVIFFSTFLLLLAAAAGFSVMQMQGLRAAVEEWQMRHRSLRMQTGTLQSSVKEHKQTEQALRQSEEKYRSLFQSAMASAMKDLEELNRNLEKRKSELEQEVGVRQRAEAALRRYTERLQIMNEVERTLLEGRSLGASIDVALKRLSDVLPLAGIVLFEIDPDRGRGLVLGRAGEVADEKWQVLTEADLADLADGTKEIRYEADVRRTGSDATTIQGRFMASGLLSYCYVPLVIEDETVGLLLMASKEADAFTDDAFDTGRDMADLMAIGIRQSRLNSERERYEAELIAARDRAEEMARLKSAFLTNMSHEIRTPISGIMGFAQVLHDEAPETLREFTGLIQEAANRLLNTINSVLELARLESGRLSIETKPIDLAAHVVESARLIEPLAVRKGIRLIIEPPMAPVIARLDRGCTERIVNNLVGNAIKFTESGHVRVSVVSDERHARLIVEDTGVGIGAEFLPHLFDEFRQEQMDANREHEGSGLGLAITKKLVDRLGGFIEVSSERGRGTTFTVQFPLFDIAVQGNGSSSKLEILVVAPHSDSASLLSRNLGQNTVATEVPSMESGMLLVAEHGFSAVVIDVNGMAPGDHVLIRDLKSRLPDARIIAVATQILPEDIGALTEIGFDTFIADAFDGDNLAKAVAGMMPEDRAAIRMGHRERHLAGALADRKWSM